MIGLLGLDSGQSFALRLRSVGDLGGVPAEHRATMQRIWGRTEQLALTTMQLCTQVLRLQGPDIESLISATYDRCVLRTVVQGWLAGWTAPGAAAWGE